MVNWREAAVNYRFIKLCIPTFYKFDVENALICECVLFVLM